MKTFASVLMVSGMMLGMVGWPAPIGAMHVPTQLAEDGIAPVTDGEWVVWASSLYDDSFSDLFASRLSTGEVLPVTRGPVLQGSYDLDRRTVVWASPEDGCQTLPTEPCDLNIYARALPSDHVYDVATTDDIEKNPVIFGTLVVWNAWDGERWHIRARDIAELSEPWTIFSHYPSLVPESDMQPVVTGSFVAWATHWEDSDPDRSFGWSLWVYNLDTDGPPQVVAEGLGLLTDFDLNDAVLVYSSAETGVVVRSLATGDAWPIATPALDVVTDGRYVISTVGKSPDGDASDGTELRGHDLWSRANFTVVVGNRFVSSPHLANGWLVWEHGGLPFPDDEYPHTIHAAPLADLLPSGRRPAADVTIPEVVYYPETGHYLGWQFRAYWDGNGGLPVFGYPLTEEYNDVNVHTVQFFERQRFEWHPENAGTPYVVLLGRLGYEDALARWLLTSEPFQPILRDIVRGDCVWFGETRQMVCTDFIRYWREHGLDFGDEGTTYRESLALFGYPISQPYVDPDTGFLTQYFERAVFELHPDNPDPYRVLLRRLGADVLEMRGW